MTISRASRLLRSSKLTSQNICQHFYNTAYFGEHSLQLNAYAKLLPLQDILAQAQQSDERIQSGQAKSLLDGIPVTIKANIAVGKYWELPNACSTILTTADEEGGGVATGEEEGIGAIIGDSAKNTVCYESDIAKKLLKDCGAVLIGITNMDEFGMGSLGINNGVHCLKEDGLQYSPTYNPLPWMQRLSSLLDSRNQNFNEDEDEDEYWLRLLQKSTRDNPHGIIDENDLTSLLDEVQTWISGSSNDIQNGNSTRSPLISPGGSSSGAASATAHGSSLLSIGTDTGGSLRLPSAWTSTVGFKPSYGSISRYGVVSYASSLDTVGYITSTAECAEIAWQCLKNNTSGDSADAIGKDVDGISSIKWNGQLCRDSTARVYHSDSNRSSSNGMINDSMAKQQVAIGGKQPLANVRVGIPSAFSLEELPPAIANGWSECANLLQNVGGATLVSIPESRISSKLIKLALASYYVLACSEASSNLSRYDGVRYGMELDLSSSAWSGSIKDLDSEEAYSALSDMKILEQQISATRAYGFGEEVQRRVLAGTSVLSSDRFHTHYEAAAIVRAKLSRSIERVFRSSSSFTDSENESRECDDDEMVDVMLVPTALSFPCEVGSSSTCSYSGKKRELDPTEAFANDVMTIPISLGGFPSVSVPFNCNHASTPIGMQLFASRGSEEQILRVANALHHV